MTLSFGAERECPPEDFASTVERISSAIESVIEGKAEVVRLMLTVLLAEGHVLLEDVPGVGKTMLAKALARSVDCSVSRIQFTPDMLPSDITGVTAYVRDTGEFEFKPGPVFANIVLGDEINRAPSKTQAALLECMEERQVTVDGITRQLEQPFMVVATQNPLDMEGTYPLPEAQRDRFMARTRIGYPSPAAELAMLDTHSASSPQDTLTPAASAGEVRALIHAVRDVYVSEAVRQYVVTLVSATRTHPRLRLGASPRSTLHLFRACRAWAALDGRDYVIPDDVQALAEPVLAHRLLPATEAELVLAELADQLTLPKVSNRSGLEARVDRLGLQGKYGEDRLVHFPQRRVFDESGERFQPEAVLTLRELALLAQVTIAHYVERLRVVGPVDDAQVLAAADLQARLDPAVCQVRWLDDDALAARRGEFQPPVDGLGTLPLRGEVDEAVSRRGDEVAAKLP